MFDRRITRLATAIGTLVALILLSGCGGGSGALETAAAKVVKIVAAPADFNGMRGIFGDAFTVGQADDAIRQGVRLGDAGFTVLTANRARKQFLDTVAGAAGAPVIVVGHNDNGLLRFQDGTSYPIGEMGTLSDGVILVISCNSNDFIRQNNVLGIPDALTYSVATATADQVIQKLSASPTVNEATDVVRQAYIASSKDAEQKKLRIALVGGTALGSVTTTGVIVVQIRKQ